MASKYYCSQGFCLEYKRDDAGFDPQSIFQLAYILFCYSLLLCSVTAHLLIYGDVSLSTDELCHQTV